MGTLLGSPGTAIVSKNGWTLYHHKTKGQIIQLVDVSNAIIDELRLYPEDAQMTTYTYDPLVAITTECDINNKVTYYEYDSLGRLKLIRDQDRNILKTFTYKYQESQ